MKTVLLILGLLALAFFLMRRMAVKQLKKMPLVEDHEAILTLTDKNFQHQTKNKVVLIDFWAAWCAPCRMMAPVLNDVAAALNSNSRIGKVNIEENRQLAQQFSIRNIPTMVIVKNGKEVARFSGVKDKAFVLNQLNQIQ